MERSNVEDQKDDWLTVVEASQLSTGMGLTRTPKTIRRWAARSADFADGVGDVVAERRDTPFGFEYVITRSSLVRKIEQELEFAKAREEETQRNDGASAQGGTPEDMGAHVRGADAPPKSSEDNQKPRGDEDLKRENEKLRTDLEVARTDAEVHKRLNQQLVADRNVFIKQIENVSRMARDDGKLIGQLETEVRQLKGLPAPSDYDNVDEQADKPEPPAGEDSVGNVNEVKKADEV